MKNLYIIGAGGCGREVLQWAKDINKRTAAWNIRGFLDADAHALDGRVCDYAVVDRPDAWDVRPDEVFVCAIGNGTVRKKIMEDFTARGGQFVSVIHPTALVADTAVLGKGVILYPYSLISDNVKIGDGCIVNMHSTVGHDAAVGDYCTVSAHCDITGMCRVGNTVFLGSGARLVPGIAVGDGAFICAGSAVMARVKEGGKMIGVPAKRAVF